jgi:uncharacterized membrane protein YoaK (UPF0700 family)
MRTPANTPEPSMPSPTLIITLRARFLIALVGGWVDVASFLALDHLMAAHITGNVVLVAADLVDGFGMSEALRLGAIPVFFLTVMLVTLLHDRLLATLPRATAFRRLFLIEGVLLAVSAGLGLALVFGAPSAVDNRLGALIALPAVMAMALQNAAHRLFPGFGAMTTVMTGNITQFVIDHSRRWFGFAKVAPTAAKADRIIPTIIAGFVVGCAASAFTTATIGFGSLALPAIALLVLVLLSAPQTAYLDRPG